MWPTQFLLVFLFFVCPFLSLSPFSYCLAPFAQTLSSPFASTQYLYYNGMRPCPFLPVPATFFGLTSFPFAPAQYLYCTVAVYDLFLPVFGSLYLLTDGTFASIHSFCWNGNSLYLLAVLDFLCPSRIPCSCSSFLLP
jgi:hypothetical protein